jgi:RNA polymerase sigma-70 factor (ECF subfamily)
MLTLLSGMSRDADLVAAVRAGNSDALGRLYEQHADAVFALALRMTASEPDAEDVLQDVFVGLPEALRLYEERGTFGAWLKRVTARTALMRLRSQRRLREESLDAAGALAGESLPITDALTARAAIARLPDALRVVFVLKEVEGYSHTEIAALLGITPGASAARLFRAWHALLGEEVRR